MTNKEAEEQPSSAYTCADYRREMILNGLMRALQNPELSEGEREKLQQEITALEKAMDL